MVIGSNETVGQLMNAHTGLYSRLIYLYHLLYVIFLVSFSRIDARAARTTGLAETQNLSDILISSLMQVKSAELGF